MRKLMKPLWYFLAALFLVETWLWDKFTQFWLWLATVLHVERWRKQLSDLVEQMPPFFSLILFLVPAIVLLPFKISALWLLAHGHVIVGGGVFLAAKMVGLGLAAFFFDLTRPRLMTMSWFARFYLTVMGWRVWAHDLLAPYKLKMLAVLVPLRQTLFEIKTRLMGESGSESAVMRKIRVLRARMNRPKT